MIIVDRVVEIDYTNYRGERGLRKILPTEIRFESTEFHPEKQWILVAFDMKKKEWRKFAMKDIHEWKTSSTD